jgi:hypothetical protein
MAPHVVDTADYLKAHHIAGRLPDYFDSLTQGEDLTRARRP